MNKFALYIFEGGELEEVVSGMINIKNYIQNYENSKRTVKKPKDNSNQAQSTGATGN